MIGLQCRVVNALKPVGTVAVNGEHWKAMSADSSNMEAGESVEVIGIEGLTLRVVRFLPKK